MAELRVSTDGLRGGAGKFDGAADSMSTAATVDHAGVEANIASFGEINAALHEQYRGVKQAQADAWSAHAQATEDHADKVRTVASGYDSTEAASTAALGTTDL
jgi:hypothetical protein